MEEVLFDEFGNPIHKSEEKLKPSERLAVPQKKKEPTEEVIKLDNL